MKLWKRAATRDVFFALLPAIYPLIEEQPILAQEILNGIQWVDAELEYFVPFNPARQQP